jgi:hypothetical protein
MRHLDRLRTGTIAPSAFDTCIGETNHVRVLRVFEIARQDFAAISYRNHAD